MIPGPRPLCRLAAALAVSATCAAFAVSIVAAGPEPGDDSRSLDCGTAALYHLLQLERRPIDLKTLMERLGEPPPGGFSMSELRNAAAQCRLEVIGARLSDASRSLDRPAIVLIKRDGGGHYLVIRPVGHTGKLVQVLDGDRSTGILDADRLYTSPEWTGLALVPRGPVRYARIVGVSLLGTGTSVMAIIAFGGRRVRPLTFRSWFRRRSTVDESDPRQR